ncbi:hypothetical protein [Bacillus rubiinfantis]|uniref:hypothetical protein n=1 Tax=Bacillus rubiinfantis TaxID=1499680 RepID=UPI0005A7C0AE|nr:hypothetical protein [Bacillus rubiinfantis]
MKIGVIIILVALLVYLIIVFKAKIISKKERKWVYLLVLLTIGCSLLVSFNLYLNGITEFLNNFFGRLARMVVKI